MVSCSVVGCKSKFGMKNIRFHRFPAARIKLWGRIMNRKNFNPTVNSRVCSQHFVSGFPGWEPSDPDWVPTLNLPKSIRKSETKLQLSRNRTIRNDNRNRIKEGKYEEFTKKLIHKKRLGLSMKFHDYCLISTGLSDSVVVEKNDLSQNNPNEYLIPKETQIETSSNSDFQVNKEVKKCLFSQGSQTDYCDLEMENRNLRQKVSDLEDDLKQRTWNTDKIKNNDEMTKFYTGMPTYAVFLWLFSFFKEKAEKMTFRRGNKKLNPGTRKRTFKLSLIDQFLAVMMRLKVGLFTQDIADRFNISPSTFSNMFQTWIKLMELELKEMFPFPSKALVDKYMPQGYLKYPNTRIIIDCSELFIERSTSLTAQNLTFSNYKQHNTIKFLVGITPGGVISFVSEGWGGRVSDKTITSESNLILLLDENDNVIADKGFLIEDLLKEKKCTLNLPPFLKGKVQFSEMEIIETRRIAELRIHVERAIGRVKKFHIFDGVMPLTIAKMTSSIFAVCSYLTNIYEPLL